MLELKHFSLTDRTASLVYTVRHSSSQLRTRLEQDLELQVDIETGKVRGALHVTELQADNIDGAREKLAIWCDRLAAALRSAGRKEGDMPLFERKPLDLASQPLWLQQEYARLVQAFTAAKTDEEHAAIKRWLQDHPMNLVSDMVERAQCEAERIRETQLRHPV